MKKLSYILSLFAFCFVLTCSCSSKQEPIDELEELSTDLENNCDNYSEDDWNKVAEKFEKIDEEIDKNKYTDEELKKIGKLKAKCYGTIIRYSAKAMKSKIHNVMMQCEGASDEIESALNDVSKELDGEFDDSDE